MFILALSCHAQHRGTVSAGSSEFTFTPEPLPAKQRQPAWLLCLSSRLKKDQTSEHPLLKRKEVNSSYWNWAMQFKLTYSQPTLPFFRYLYNHSLNAVEYNCTHTLSKHFKEQIFWSFSFLHYFPSYSGLNSKCNCLDMKSESFKTFCCLSCILSCPFSVLTWLQRKCVVDCRLVQSFQLTITKVTVDICVLRIKKSILQSYKIIMNHKWQPATCGNVFYYVFFSSF